MDRKQFLFKSLCGLAVVSFSETLFSCSAKTESLSRFHGTFAQSEGSRLPDKKQTAFGWKAHDIGYNSRKISFLEMPMESDKVFLRISVAVEVWEKMLVKASIGHNGPDLGVFDIRYAPALTPFQIEIDPIYIPDIVKNGILLTQIQGEHPLWVFERGAGMPITFMPHLIAVEGDQDKWSNFREVFTSKSSIQTFGWREGCVLDGLYQLFLKKGDKQSLQTLRDHLKMYIPKDDLEHLDAWNRERGNHLGTIESTLPFASLIKVEPHHPVLKHVEDFWKAKRRASGIVTTGSTITAEGCYTVGYPMAVMSVFQQREDMAKWAVDQIAQRHVLSKEDDFYLRYNPDRDLYYMKNWARGTAWYLLGTARVLETLKYKKSEDSIVKQFREDVDKVVAFQQSNGLWNCYLHEESVPPDTSGSSGIATAIAVGVNCGILPESYRSVSKATIKALDSYLTPDGYLSGVAQDNRGDEELQKGNYRVIAQMGMGLMAQLYAEL